MGEWEYRYVKRLVEKGLDEDLAIDTYNAGFPHDEDFNPEDAADDELSYWVDD